MSTETINETVEGASVPDAQVETQEVSATEPQEQTDEGTQEAPKEVKDPWPKSAKNKVSRLERETRILRAQQREYMAELEKLRQPQPKEPQKSNNGEPVDTDFDNYGDYLKAVARHEAKQELLQGQQKQQEQTLSAQEAKWVEERSLSVAEKANEIIESNPKYAELLQDNIDIVDTFPPAIERAFLEADNAPAAFIALAEEGRLEALAYMSPAKAAMEIARAEIRGEAMLKAKPITNAPAPLSPNRGTGNAGKTLENMKGDDILKIIRASRS
jgi:hypothetical protein